MSAYKWLYIAEYLDKVHGSNEAIDLVMDTVDGMLCAGDFRGVREALRVAAQEVSSDAVLLTLLTTTHWFMEKADAYGQSYHGVKCKLRGMYEAQGMTLDEIENILVGL